jgi:hypothetical protein
MIKPDNSDDARKRVQCIQSIPISKITACSISTEHQYCQLNLMELQHANRYKKMKLGLYSSEMLRGVTSQKSKRLNYGRQKPENSHA